LENGRVNIWRIQSASPATKCTLEHTIDTKSSSSSRVIIVRWHPVAADILCVACADNTVNVWRVGNVRPVFELADVNDTVCVCVCVCVYNIIVCMYYSR
jgi:hypothetical protein